MKHANKSSNKIESIIVAVLMLIGIIGAMNLFSGSQEKLSNPGHALEAQQPAYEVSVYSGDTDQMAWPN